MNNLFPERLREMRLRLNMTQKEFAALCEIAPVSVSAYENGQKSPPLGTALRIAEKCEVSLDWLCGLATSGSQDKRLRLGDAIDELLDIAGKLHGASLYANQWHTKDIEEEFSPDVIDRDHIQNLSDENGMVPVPTMVILDYRIMKFFADYAKLIQLCDEKVIDREVVTAWREKRLLELNRFPADPADDDVEAEV